MAIRFIVAAAFLAVVACRGSSSTPTAPAQNGAPTVAVVFPGASTCAPSAGAPCGVEVLAQAGDPDGDALQYSWSGCASGTAARATCAITAIGPATASVAVSDGHGHTVNASGAAEGVAVPNAPPRVTVAFQSATTCTLVGGKPCVIDVIATASDPDGDALSYRWSGCATGTAPKASCTIDHAGPAVASVDVSDDHGHTVRGEVSGSGLPDANEPPEVRVLFDGPSQCAPVPPKPLGPPGGCTLNVLVQASDPDGDALRYNWSGCAAGNATRATCTIDRPGSFEAKVEVNDDHGHIVVASAGAHGSNEPPGVQVGYVVLIPNSNEIDLLGNIMDPDEGFLCGRQYCVSAVAEGVCRFAKLDCTCLAGLEAAVIRTATSGTCTVTFTLKDTWGQTGTPKYSFDVSSAKSNASIKKN
jgi:hypothetical protein